MSQPHRDPESNRASSAVSTGFYTSLSAQSLASDLPSVATLLTTRRSSAVKYDYCRKFRNEHFVFRQDPDRLLRRIRRTSGTGAFRPPVEGPSTSLSGAQHCDSSIRRPTVAMEPFNQCEAERLQRVETGRFQQSKDVVIQQFPGRSTAPSKSIVSDIPADQRHCNRVAQYGMNDPVSSRYPPFVVSGDKTLVRHMTTGDSTSSSMWRPW